ncbi:MAG: alpha/beta fold hydrolase [Pseudonocardiaceae bacterium]
MVIVAALGTPGSEWLGVQQGLAHHTGVYVYDRAGLGWSDPAPWPRTYPRMADELHQLLTAAAIPPPYLLVGHSTGGIIVRQFAARHPEGLAGLVLIDSSHEDQIRRLSPFKNHERVQLWRRAARCRLKPLGLIRITQDLGIRARPTDPAAIIAQTSRCRRADAQELINHALTMPWSTPPDLGDLPLTVITAGAAGRGRRQPVWLQMQAELVGLSTHSTQLVAENAGHHINHDDPDFLIQALREAIIDLRHRSV